MVKWTVNFLLAWTLVAGLSGAARAAEMGIITGSDKGTYYQFGLNLQKLVKQGDFDLNVYTSKGSIEHILAVYQRPGTQLGIVQARAAGSARPPRSRVGTALSVGWAKGAWAWCTSARTA